MLKLNHSIKGIRKMLKRNDFLHSVNTGVDEHKFEKRIAIITLSRRLLHSPEDLDNKIIN